jgi:excisionase family DNA binding protein
MTFDAHRNRNHRNMKNPQSPVHYYSTSQAAKMLGLSVGTVQRMVQNGIFKAFITQGGHRRILSSSLNDYFTSQGFAQPQPTAGAALVCILHDSEHMTEPLSTLGHWENVKLMTHPLDLMSVEQEIGVFFIDARIPWLHTESLHLHLQSPRMQSAQIVIYNSQLLLPNSPLTLDQHISLFEQDISTDLVYGYLLCVQHNRPPSTPKH